MRISWTLAAFLMLAPAGAFAQGIVGSRHDLSVTGNANAHATTEAELCKFCHTPHKANSTSLLWNHRQTAVAAFTWGGATITAAGTTLPSSLKPASKQCMGCHDGTISVGDLYNGGAGIPSIIAMTGAGLTAGGMLAVGSAYLLASGGDMSGNHPISIPYAGQANYNGISSTAIANGTIGNYWGVAVAGCNTPSGVCTTATGGGLDGTRINLLRDTTTNTYGIECTSCHEPHNQFGGATGNVYFLRLGMSQSVLCRSCHNK
ncbi:MAG: hypothetical protein HY791_13390 [Deltaproteobacteria bacterium]|nr:hypothetical protein [Deltaproteobacteria bacterium]